MSPLPFDRHHETLIIIPTVASPPVLVPAFMQLLRHLDNTKTHIVLSVNPINPEDGAKAIDECFNIWTAYKEQLPGCMLSIYNHGKPAGFGGAINLGLKVALGMLGGHCWGIPALTIFYNDDLQASEGWIQGMHAALKSETVLDWSEPADRTGKRPVRAMSDYGHKIGLVGPVTNNAAGIQNVSAEDVKRWGQMGTERMAAMWRQKHSGEVITATFLSGFCLGISFECMQDLHAYTPEVHGDQEHREFSWLFDERYKIAGYEDNDLCVRADRNGWRAVVAADTFVGHIGHQTFDTAFPEMERGMRNRLVFYDKFRDSIRSARRNVIAVYRVRLDVPYDLEMFRASLQKVCTLVDGIAVLLTERMARVMDTAEYAHQHRTGQIRDSDKQALLASAASPEDSNILAGWIWSQIQKVPGNRVAFPAFGEQVLKVERWTQKPMNERTERNHLLSIAEGMGATWILSVDHDEVPEPRLTRDHLNRMMLHPDPLVQSWDVAFVNHWENERMYRVDAPWGDGGSWKGAMRGHRFFRVNQAAPRRIMAGSGEHGLHCGNVPSVDPMAKRAAGFRFRHLGYMRPQDRLRKEARYNEQDPNPDPYLVGGADYSHITRDDGMVLSPYNPDTGIGLHMLAYEKEKPDDYGRILDHLHGLIDCAVVVWTGNWAPDDYGSVDIEQSGLKFEWPFTGPSAEMCRMLQHFNVTCIHHPLKDDLGKARNAGINWIDDIYRKSGVGWALCMDPDEQLPYGAPIMLRRMAEAGSTFGWLFSFVNRHADGSVTMSENVRMSRLDKQKSMRFHGRVHEGFAKSTRALVKAGAKNVLRKAPFQVMNLGLAQPPEAMQAKLDHYRRLCEMQLREDPADPGCWTTLGLYWLNENALETARVCFERACMCAQDEFLPFEQMAQFYGRLAKAYYGLAIERLGHHPKVELYGQAVELLDKAAPEMAMLGTSEARGGTADAVAIGTLPPFPPPANP